MSSLLENLQREINSLQQQLPTAESKLEKTRESLQETQTQRATIVTQLGELRRLEQQFQEQLKKITEQMTNETKLVQDSEKNLEQMKQDLKSKNERIVNTIKREEEEKKAKEAFDNSPEGIAYQDFLREFPQHKNTSRTYCVEWAYYLIRRAQQFEQEWKEYLKANNNGSEYCWMNMRSGPSQTFRFPEFPQIQVGPHESDGTNKVNNGRYNFHSCHQWFENNKKLLEQHKASQKAYNEKQQQEHEKAKVEQQKRNEEEEKKSAIFREAVIKLFLEKVGNSMTEDEANAILGKFYVPQNTQYLQTFRNHHPIDTSQNVYLWKNVFKQDSLLAMKVCNRFAQQNEIRVEDATALFQEYAAIKYTLPKEYNVIYPKEGNNITRKYIRDVNC